MKQEIYTMLEEYMLSCMEDSAHDKEHIYRVLYNALQIAETEEMVDYDLLITACLLHDIGRKEQNEDPALCHATVGGEKAYSYLMKNGFDTSFAERVKRCIQSHRYREKNLPESVEAKILFDADKLDAVGTVGIARTLLYQGANAEPLYALNKDGIVSDGTDDNGETFFREYKFKLEKLYDRFFTVKGKAMALERRAALYPTV